MLESLTSRLGIGAFKQRLPRAEEALPGRQTPLPLRNVHFVNGQPLQGEFPSMETIGFGMGCFWGAERKFWQLPGVVTTAVGYQGGFTPNPTYEESCTGMTGHAEVVRVVFDPAKVSLDEVLRTFWENHDPTQGMRQGNDRGTEYRSAIYCETQASTTPRWPAAMPISNAWARPATARSPPRSSTRRRRSTTPRTTTSSTWPRTRPAIAAWAAPA